MYLNSESAQICENLLLKRKVFKSSFCSFSRTFLGFNRFSQGVSVWRRACHCSTALRYLHRSPFVCLYLNNFTEFVDNFTHVYTLSRLLSPTLSYVPPILVMFPPPFNSCTPVRIFVLSGDSYSTSAFNTCLEVSIGTRWNHQ